VKKYSTVFRRTKTRKGVVSIKTNVLFWKTNLLIRRSEWFFSFEQRKNFKVEKGKIGILGHMRPAHHPLINEVFDTQFLLPLIFASSNVSIQQSHRLRSFLMHFVYNVYI